MAACPKLCREKYLTVKNILKFQFRSNQGLSNFLTDSQHNKSWTKVFITFVISSVTGKNMKRMWLVYRENSEFNLRNTYNEFTQQCYKIVQKQLENRNQSNQKSKHVASNRTRDYPDKTNSKRVCTRNTQSDTKFQRSIKETFPRRVPSIRHSSRENR
jgi:hypothetical protein